ncbi:MFS transporter [Paenibacillus lutrae]|uniref:MFS transporter n=1 Tax=Paenibacillus lutrae TaxID=2078573 RepID=A0A7X3FLI9_9BACL|nr:MFS transporter [Paenibacillus lutrae]MVP01936.1 MFS transporter [Paenibacillus lutrae]
MRTKLAGFGAGSPRAQLAQAVLLGCVFLGLFTEVLLSPFYPQFFSKVFGVEDYAFTGVYIFVCRLTVVLISPLWGLLSKRFEAKHLLVAGQAGTAVCTALMATAGTAAEFLVITVLLLLFKSSYMLIYPLMIELSEGRKNAATAAKFHAVHHTAIIVSTLVGAKMLGMEQPLTLFYGAAAADAVQLALCVWVLRGYAGQAADKAEPAVPGDARTVEASKRVRPAEAQKAGVRNRQVSAEKKPVSLSGTASAPSIVKRYGFLLAIGIVFCTLALANNLIRPFFTPLAEARLGTGTETGSLLFLIPSAMAVAAMPLIRRLCVPERSTAVYTAGIAIMAAGLLLQAAADSMLVMVIGRMLYGLFLALTMAVLDVMLFDRSSGSSLPLHFSVIVSFQNVGELLSPLLASSLAREISLTAPLVAAALLCLVNLLLFFIFVRSAASGAGKSKRQPESEIYC